MLATKRREEEQENCRPAAQPAGDIETKHTEKAQTLNVIVFG